VEGRSTGNEVPLDSGDLGKKLFRSFDAKGTKETKEEKNFDAKDTKDAKDLKVNAACSAFSRVPGIESEEM
jgi:hypothetical protein